MRHRTTPFVSRSPGGEVVMTSGSYPYVRAKAYSHPVREMLTHLDGGPPDRPNGHPRTGSCDKRSLSLCAPQTPKGHLKRSGHYRLHRSPSCARTCTSETARRRSRDRRSPARGPTTWVSEQATAVCVSASIRAIPLPESKANLSIGPA